MSKLKRVVCAVLCVLLLTAAVAGCSTPEYAMTINGENVTTGEYLANLYNVFYQLYYNQGLYYYEQYGSDVWGQSYPYGEGDATQSLPLSDYIKQMTQDSLVRQRAIASLMEKYGVTLSEEDQKDLQNQLEGISNSNLLELGFNKENYRKMVTGTFNERGLFYGLYDEGGQRAISAEDLRAYFDANYLTYKSIEISLENSDGEALSEEEIAEITERLEGYLAIYNETGDFDKAIEQYTEDNSASSSTTTTGSDSTTGTGDSTTTADDETTTANPEETTTTGEDTAPTAAPDDETTTAGTGDTTTTTTGAQDDEDEEEEETDANLKTLVAEKASDQELVKAIQSVEEGTAKIVQYNKNGETTTAALILRLDPEGEGREDYFEESHDNIIYNMKWDEFDKEVTELIATYTVEVNAKTIKMCDPKNFLDA